MLLTTFPLRPARTTSFDRRFERAMSQLTDLAISGQFGRQAPSVAGRWNDGAYVLSVDVPGVPEEALSVSVAGRTLVLDVATDELTWSERLRLPRTLDVEAITATYANGRLTVTVPSAPEVQPRKVEISTAAPTPALDAGSDQAESPTTDTE